MFQLDKKVALVTGGCGVLGSAIAAALGEAGAQVVVTSRSQERAADTQERLRSAGIEAKGLALEDLDRPTLSAGLDAIESDYGPVDILVNAAGGNVKEATVSPDCDFFHLPEQALEDVVKMNLFPGAMTPCQVVGERMVASGTPGSIINISSMNAFRPLTRIAGYSAAKAAVSNFTQWLAVYFARDLGCDVRVNAIAPGFFLTDQNRALLTTEDGGLTDRGRQVNDHTPMGRFGNPEDLAGTAVWLASDASAFVTGVVVPVDGGFSAFSGV